MMLMLSVILGLAPLAGIAWIAIHASLTTVDGLFTTLILLALSGILFLNAGLEWRRMRKTHTATALATATAKKGA
jgi:hypothetical protein